MAEMIPLQTPQTPREPFHWPRPWPPNNKLPGRTPAPLH
jgi:hypothetical protein